MKTICDVCSSEIEPSINIEMEPFPEYQTTISIKNITGPKNIQFDLLPDHIADMHMMALAPVVRCPSCGVEDPQCSQKIFENLAHIKAFSAMPDGRFLMKLRSHFGASRQWLADKIGYDSLQSIYRFENKLITIPRYAVNQTIIAFLHRNDLENERDEWMYNYKDWNLDSIDMINKTVLVPLPSKKTFKIPDYEERKYRDAVKANPSLAMID